jgi:hypothetical protein
MGYLFTIATRFFLIKEEAVKNESIKVQCGLFFSVFADGVPIAIGR